MYFLSTKMEKFLLSHIEEIIGGILAFAWVVVRLTPSKKDNDILSVIAKIINIFLPNRKKGGGTH